MGELTNAEMQSPWGRGHGNISDSQQNAVPILGLKQLQLRAAKSSVQADFYWRFNAGTKLNTALSKHSETSDLYCGDAWATSAKAAGCGVAAPCGCRGSQDKESDRAKSFQKAPLLLPKLILKGSIKGHCVKLTWPAVQWNLVHWLVRAIVYVYQIFSL